MIGRFAAPIDAALKYYDKASDARSAGAIAEDGTGAVKYYDKVPQTETGQSFGDAPEQKCYARAELSAYSTTARITGNGTSVVVPGATVVTA